LGGIRYNLAQTKLRKLTLSLREAKTMHIAWLIAAFTIIVALSAIAIHLHLKLHRQRKRMEEAQREQAEKLERKTQEIHRDIRFLARAYLDDQAELNEVSLRIHHLVNYLSLEDDQRSLYHVFDSVTQQIEHIPTHENWKSLDKASRSKYQKEFIRIESEFAHQAKISAKSICDEKQKSHLH